MSLPPAGGSLVNYSISDWNPTGYTDSFCFAKSEEKHICFKKTPTLVGLNIDAIKLVGKKLLLHAAKLCAWEASLYSCYMFYIVY